MNLHWLHHLLNPHCQDCKDEKLENKVCASCETLKMQLAIANQEKERLLQALIDNHKPIVETSISGREEFKPIAPSMMSWRMRQQSLEAESRRAAELIAKSANKNDKDQQEVEKLERELGLFESEEAHAISGA